MKGPPTEAAPIRHTNATYRLSFKRGTVIVGPYERGHDRQAYSHRNCHGPNVNPHKSASMAVRPSTRSWAFGFSGGGWELVIFLNSRFVRNGTLSRKSS